MTEWHEIKGYIYSEAAFIIATCAFAAFQVWPMFAIGALLCVLVPMWATAAACIVLAVEIASQEGSGGDDE